MEQHSALARNREHRGFERFPVTGWAGTAAYRTLLSLPGLVRATIQLIAYDAISYGASIVGGRIEGGTVRGQFTAAGQPRAVSAQQTEGGRRP